MSNTLHLSKPSIPRLNVAKAAEYLGVSVHTLNSKHSRGTGPDYIKRGHRVFYEIPALDEWSNSIEQVMTSTTEVKS